MQNKLDDIEKKHPFEVPEHYFDKLTSDIQSRVTSKQPKTAWTKKWALALPAFVLIIVAGIWLYSSTEETSATEQLLAEVSDEAILDYLDNSDISLEELAELSSNPEDLFAEPDFLNGIDLKDENLEELLNNFDLDENYL